MAILIDDGKLCLRSQTSGNWYWVQIFSVSPTDSALDFVSAPAPPGGTDEYLVLTLDGSNYPITIEDAGWTALNIGDPTAEPGVESITLKSNLGTYHEVALVSSPTLALDVGDALNPPTELSMSFILGSQEAFQATVIPGQLDINLHRVESLWRTFEPSVQTGTSITLRAAMIRRQAVYVAGAIPAKTRIGPISAGPEVSSAPRIAKILQPDPNAKKILQSKFKLGITSMRIHELALHRWLNSRFMVADGFPIPVVFSKPMHAYADFSRYWKDPENNPYAYLLQAKDENGAPLYRPYPAPPILPLISFERKSWRYDSQRSFGSHWWRNIGWPTVSNDVKVRDLGNVFQQRMPQAWNYSVQIDHFATRPDTQAFFISNLQQAFFGSQAEPHVWIACAYPGFFGKKLIRVALEGDITDLTEESPAEGYRTYRTSLMLRVEAWVPDFDKLIVPALWTKVDEISAATPDLLDKIYGEPDAAVTQDLRDEHENPAVLQRLQELVDA